jgi:hypothetical protein
MKEGKKGRGVVHVKVANEEWRIKHSKEKMKTNEQHDLWSHYPPAPSSMPG